MKRWPELSWSMDGVPYFLSSASATLAMDGFLPSANHSSRPAPITFSWPGMPMVVTFHLAWPGARS